MSKTNRIAFSGQKGDKIRSDCYVQIQITEENRINLDIKSKVNTLYGKSIRSLFEDLINFFQITSADIDIDDKGAVPFVMAARFEAAFKKLFPHDSREYLLPSPYNKFVNSSRNRFRRSRLYLPGNEPKYFMNAGLHKPDGIILDLEDSVAFSEKDSARLLVRNALRSVNFYDSEIMVRINQLPNGLHDLEYIVPHGVQVILIPKVESAEQIHIVEEKVSDLMKKNDVSNNIFYMPIIESALGVLKSYEIAKASKYNIGLAIGLEDYTADIGTNRTLKGDESFFARSMVVNAAKAAGIQAIDTVFSDVSDMEGLRQSVLEAKSLGFEGKGCIHPRQIDVIHKAFAPSDEEIQKAQKIFSAFREATEKGLGVISIGSKMIDPPVVKRAINVLKLSGLFNEGDKI